MSYGEQTTISILGDEVVATHCSLDIKKLLFLPDNPRVYAAIRKIEGFEQLTRDEQQEKIYNELLSEPSVQNVRPEIKRDGGLQEPITIRRDTLEVIEGNSRLAVYRELHNADPHDERWQTIRCLDIGTPTRKQQFRLLGQAHLHGKTEWTAFARALFCYRCVCEEGESPDELKETTGLTVKAINKQIDIVELMQENEDEKESHYSYYDVAMTNRKISSEIRQRKDNPLRDIVLAGIREENFTAQQLRDWLPVVLDKPKVAKKFASGAIDLKDAHDRAEVSETKTRLDRILGLLDAIETKDINGLDFAEIRAVHQVAKKINTRANRLCTGVEQRVEATRKLSSRASSGARSSDTHGFQSAQPS